MLKVQLSIIRGRVMHVNHTLGDLQAQTDSSACLVYTTGEFERHGAICHVDMPCEPDVWISMMMSMLCRC